MTGRLIRQGDLLLVPVDAAPATAQPVEQPGGRAVLAEGEATGHQHVLEAERLELVSSEQAQELYVLVYGADARLVHDEHDPLPVASGAYRVVRQREYQPDAPPRFVSD